MIITFPTSQGQISFMLNGTLLKVLGLALLILATMAGYAVIQVANFVLSVTPSQFSHMLAFTFLVGIALLVRRILTTTKKGRAK